MSGYLNAYLYANPAKLKKLAADQGLTFIYKLSNQEVIEMFQMQWVNGELKVVPKPGIGRQLLDKGFDLLQIVAIFEGGAPGALCAKTPGVFNFKFVKDAFLESKGINAHAVKADALGTRKNLDLFDIYRETSTGKLWVFRKGGKGGGIPTDVFFNKIIN